MATGIFGTVRVAGEGVALAVVSAALAALITGALHHGSGLPGEVLTKAGQRLAVGDAAGMTVLSHQLDSSTVTQAYQVAFATLSRVLAGITTLCAVAVFVQLSRADEKDATSMEVEEPASTKTATREGFRGL